MSNSSYNDFADNLSKNCDIVSIIAENVVLKRKGRNYWGCCPFHGEKTPSFSVNQEKKMFYCFGCHVGGNIYNFLMKLNGWTFREALKTLAEKMNVELPAGEHDAIYIKKKQENEVLFRAVSLASDFFHSCLLKSSYGVLALQYLAKRGLEEEIIKKFKIGFSPPLWDRLNQEMQKKGFSVEELFKAGLIKKKRDGINFNDVFRGRIIFPISNERGNVIAFGGRAIASDVHPKYLNSNETAIFNKRKVLFGFYEAKEAIRQEKYVFVVEGYMDVVAMQAHGISNVVASLGTAFTPEQAKQILNITSRVIFVYDNDDAGKNAVLRAGNVFKSKDADVRVLTLIDAKDPDEFLGKFGVEKFRERLQNAKPFLDYKVEVVLSKHDLLDGNDKSRAVKDVVAALVEAADAITAELYLSKIAKEFSVSELTLKAEYEKTSQLHKANNNVQSKVLFDDKVLDKAINRIMNASNAATLAERNLIYCMLKDASLALYIREQLEAEDFTKLRVDIVSKIFAMGDIENNIQNLINTFEKNEIENISKEECEEFHRIMMYDYEYYFVDFLRNVDECIKQIKISSLERQIFTSVQNVDLLEQIDENRSLQELEKIRVLSYELTKWKSKEC